jgi:predicted peroxiredoxin
MPMKTPVYKALFVLFISLLLMLSFGSQAMAAGKKKILFHSFVGSENPTRASFPFLQAVANKERGDEVVIILAGDGVVMIKDSIINAVVPVAWPSMKETFKKVLKLKIPIYL